MYIAHDIPPPPKDLAWATIVLVGEEFPQISEKDTGARADANRKLAEDMAGVLQQLQTVRAALQDAGQGPAIDKATEYISSLLDTPYVQDGKGNEPVIPALVAALHDV